jgi:general secretion pathway protein F/type IV pilus assembly protein PilC
MPEFTYEAMAGTGIRSQGTLTANSEREVMAMLDARGMYPIRIAASKSGVIAGKGGRRIKKSILATFYGQLADLLHSGVPLLRSLELLQRQTTNVALSEVLREIRAKVADGTSLAEAMSRHPRAFDDLAVSMVRAGQEGGFLEDVLRRIADFTEHQQELMAKVVGSVVYPVVLAIAGTGIIILLMLFAVPRFEPIFKKLEDKGDMPGLTVVVVTISHMIGSWVGAVLGIVLALALFGFRAWAGTEGGRRKLDAVKLRIPGAGKIFVSLAISRFTRILGTLMHNGIPILQSLRIAKDSMGNKVLADAIEKSAENIKAGNSLAKPLGASGLFPNDIVEMVAVGEESNNLENVLINISVALEKRTTRALELFVKLLEPVLLLVMAFFIFIIVMALLLPVFKISSVVN